LANQSCVSFHETDHLKLIEDDLTCTVMACMHAWHMVYVVHSHFVSWIDRRSAVIPSLYIHASTMLRTDRDEEVTFTYFPCDRSCHPPSSLFLSDTVHTCSPCMAARLRVRFLVEDEPKTHKHNHGVYIPHASHTSTNTYTIFVDKSLCHGSSCIHKSY
jgi:hypothetical protein